VSGASDAASASQSPSAPELPVSVAVTELPTFTVVALTVNRAGGSIVKDTALDVPPPGVGDCTVTCAAPLDARSLAAINARICVSLTKVVGRGVPFH